MYNYKINKIFLLLLSCTLLNISCSFIKNNSSVNSNSQEKTEAIRNLKRFVEKTAVYFIDGTDPGWAGEVLCQVEVDEKQSVIKKLWDFWSEHTKNISTPPSKWIPKGVQGDDIDSIAIEVAEQVCEDIDFFGGNKEELYFFGYSRGVFAWKLAIDIISKDCPEALSKIRNVNFIEGVNLSPENQLFGDIKLDIPKSYITGKHYVRKEKPKEWNDIIGVNKFWESVFQCNVPYAEVLPDSITKVEKANTKSGLVQEDNHIKMGFSKGIFNAIIEDENNPFLKLESLTQKVKHETELQASKEKYESELQASYYKKDCSRQESDLKTLDEIEQIFNNNYAPRDWKKEQGIDIDKIFAITKKKLKEECISQYEFHKIVRYTLKGLKDYHVKITFRDTNKKAVLPFLMGASYGIDKKRRYFIKSIQNKTISALDEGDEVLQFDGFEMDELIKNIVYQDPINDLERDWQKATINFTIRKTNRADDLPKNKTAIITVRKQTGDIKTVQLDWDISGKQVLSDNDSKIKETKKEEEKFPRPMFHS